MKPGPNFLACAAIALLAATAARADYFMGGYYTPARGKVGVRLISDADFDVSDMPPGCVVQWKNITVSGDLPPGMLAPGAGVTLVSPSRDENGIPYSMAQVPDVSSSAFSGTPRQAGDWPVMVTFHDLSCSATQAFGDRTLKVNFHISP